MNTRTTARTTTLRRVTTQAAATLALSAAVAGLTGGVASASSVETAAAVGTVDGTSDPDVDPPADGTMDIAASRRVAVTNLTDYTLKLRAIEGDQWFEGHPRVGEKIGPLDEHGFEMQLQWPKVNNETVTYDIYRPDGTLLGTIVLKMTLTTSFTGGIDQQNSCLLTTIHSQDPSEKITCTSDRSGFTITMPEGTVRTLDGSGANSVAAGVFQRLCDTGRGICSFDPTSPGKAMYGEPTPVGSVLANVSELQQSKTVSISDAESASDSLGGSLTLKIPVPIVETSLQVNYNHTWTKTHTFQDTSTINVPAGHYGWFMKRVPVIRHTGDFTVEANGTTWHINNVAIDSPDPNRKIKMVPDTRAMTEEQKAEERGNFDPATGGTWSPDPMIITTHGVAKA